MEEFEYFINVIKREYYNINVDPKSKTITGNCNETGNLVRFDLSVEDMVTLYNFDNLHSHTCSIDELIKAFETYREYKIYDSIEI